MNNIIKSMIYELRKSRFVLVLFLVIAAANVLVTVLNISANTFNEATTSAMLSEAKNTTFLFAEFFVIAAVGIIIGSDFKDKVANYELMSGHSRIQVYLARSVFAVILSALLGTVLAFVFLVTGNIFFGFGGRLVLSDVILRTFLYLFPFLRVAAFTVILTFTIKNQYVVMGIGYGIETLNSVFSGVVSDHDNLLTANFNLNLLADYDGWSVYNLSSTDGIVNYACYDSSLSSGAIVGTILVSVIVMVVYLIIGYGLFRRDDLN